MKAQGLERAMRSQPFVIVMAVLCGATAIACVPLGLRLWQIYQLRRDHYRAVSLVRESRYEEALSCLDRSIARMPADTSLYRLGALISSRLGRPDGVRRYLDGLLKHAQGPEAASAHLRLGLLDLNGSPGEKPDLASAIAHFESALKENEGLTDARAALGVAWSIKGDADRARPRLDRAWAEAAAREPGELAASARLWTIADLLRRGQAAEAWVAYRELVSSGATATQDDYRVPLALTLAFRVDAPGLSSVVRRLCLKAMEGLPQNLQDQHGVLLHTLAAAALERLGDDAASLSEYRRAYDLDPNGESTRRNLGHALYTAAAREQDEAERTRLLDESAKLHRDLLTAGSFSGDEQRQVALALATRAWNEGRIDDALRLLRTAGDVGSALAERMRAAAAIRKGDYREAIPHLQEAAKLDGGQADVADILERLRTPPDIRNFRVNGLGPFDPRPILAATVVPRALPIPIPSDKITMKLDGDSVQPLIAHADCFFRPTRDLAPGEHRVEIAATDSLGLTATKTLTFTVQEDKEPPTIAGISPAPDSRILGLEPVISFRCADPSGIDEHSLFVAFSGRVGRRPQPQDVTIVDKGFYKIELKRSNITPGTPVRYGALSFQFSYPLGEGECSVRVAVADTRGNRCVKKWSFTCGR